MKNTSITIAGRNDDPYFTQCQTIALYIKTKNPKIIITELSFFETEWDQYMSQLKQLHGGKFFWHNNMHIAYFDNGKYIGKVNEFLVFAQKNYDYKEFNNLSYYRFECDKRQKEIYSQSDFCYMNIQIGNSEPIMALIKLYSNLVPKTCKTFCKLCEGCI